MAATAEASAYASTTDTTGRWGGRAGTANLVRGKSTWIKDYLSADPVYTDVLFRRRFGVPLFLFWRVHDALLELDYEFWGTRYMAGGRRGIDSRIKLLACLRLLRTGAPYDQLDDGARMAEETTRLYFRRFTTDMIRLYGDSFLNRRPTFAELQSIFDDYTQAGFPGCAGAIDCMKLRWKNCPIAHKGQYHNSKEGKLATIPAEAWCDRNLYIWHWFVGRTGTNNDINVLMNSPLMQDILSGHYKLTTGESYKLVDDGVTRDMLYLLADGIYPDWIIFAKPIHHPTTVQEKEYSKLQESVRKDVERCFGVLQSRFEILRRENRRWDVNEVARISETCVILHNMLVKMVEDGDIQMEDGEDIITELLEDHLENTHGAHGLGSDTDNGSGDNELTMTQAEDMLLSEFSITTRVGFETLRKELVDMFS